MGLVEADLGPGVRVSMGTSWYTFTCPFKDHPLDTHHEPSALYCWMGSFTAIRKDAGLCCGSRLRKGEVFACVGSIQNLKDLKNGLFL